MNLYLRMMMVYLAALNKDWITLDALHNRLSLRVLPNDLDLNRHMNNGRYLTICDLSRVDMFIRTGLFRVMLSNRWMPVIREHTMSYIKPLRLLQPYEVEMRIVRWDEKYFHSAHSFSSGGVLVAEGMSVAGIRGREGMKSPETILQAVEDFQRIKRR